MKKKARRQRVSDDFDDSLVDVVPEKPSGYDTEIAKADTNDALCGIGAREFPDHLWIEPRDWKEIAAQNDRYKTWPIDWRNRTTHQGNTHSCTCQTLMQVMEIAWNRQAQTKEHAVWLSPLSVYAIANSRRWGGSTMQRTLSIAMQNGMLPDNNGPKGDGTQRDKFEHTLHQDSSAGPWVPLSRFPAGWKTTARHFRPLEVVNVTSWEQHVCLVLNGYAVGHGRWGHAMPGVKIVWRGNDLFSVMSDSYHRLTYDSERAIRAGIGGAYSIITTTLPDDWDSPTG